LRDTGAEEISSLAGLHQRSPLLAAAMTISMVSLAGIPPLAGFFGKLLLIKSALVVGAEHQSFYWLVGIAVVGVVISLAYYLVVVRAIYWGGEATEKSAVTLSLPATLTVAACLVGILFIGIYPNPLMKAAEAAVLSFK
jgi:NADH-quinone oxidoreductase subunit N